MHQVQHFSRFTDYDIHLFRQGKHYKLHEKLGSHLETVDDQPGTYFAVWAPNALRVAVIGDFNGWNINAHHLFQRWDGSGIWEGFIPGVGKGALYKYFLVSPDGRPLQKGDPFARFWEIPPNTASIVWEPVHSWKDGNWMKSRAKANASGSAMSVYEVHLGSWKKQNMGESLSYRELAVELVGYVRDMGFTHVELMPVMEHPYFPSWGYQITGYFAPSSRFGPPEDLMYLIDAFHQAGIGVLLDWVPSHFPSDAHGLADFDGTHLFEHADPRKGFHPDWQSYIFNYGRYEVRSFLLSNALYWLDQYHADGLRVDAVASMLYLDYSRNEGEWIPNEWGGRENLEAISFLKEFNEVVYAEFPDAVTIAEESTAWPKVSMPTYDGGLGFGQKWMMGWMHDTLSYFKEDPINRKYHHDKITFSIIYAFSEHFMLPLSHDEVVHMKGSLIGRMPGSDEQKFANLRLLFTYMFTHPGTKLLFMGGEFGQWSEWSEALGLDWSLVNGERHKGLQALVRDLNQFYRSEGALFENQFEAEGFEWIDLQDYESSVLVYLRKGEEKTLPLVVVLNFTPVIREGYRIGLPYRSAWKEVFNSDALEYGGGGIKNGKIEVEKEEYHGRPYSAALTIPALGAVVLQPSRPFPKRKGSRSQVAGSK